MVVATHTRTDERIKKDVTDSLYWDTRVNAADMTIEVEQGRVTLSGTVPTYSALEAALDDALMTQDVIDVDNQLVVSHPTGFSVPTDSEIRDSIRHSLAMSPEIDSSAIEVFVDRGKATLRGSIDSYANKLRAEEIAGNRSGVLEVRNELAVVPTKRIADREIADDIVAALERNSLVDPEDVDVSVRDGEVTLRGTVPSWGARRASRQAAWYTAGVTEVRDHLMVTF